ncbi:MAG: hypothetical protein ABS81_05335 [Pseudonocardia sp. SCN 72-86]|nr:MAG: hypothetical protein ABS81_05335 [Pseudonocardia sp. SCN 72-86]
MTVHAGPRLLPLPATGNPAAVQELLDDIELNGGAPAMNWFRTIAHAGGLLRRYRGFGAKLLSAGRLSARIREIVVLRTASRCGCAYELAHHRPIAAAVGLTDAEVDAICGFDLPDPLGSATENALLRAVDQLCSEHTVGDPEWALLAGTHPSEELVELLFLVGHYVMVAGVMNALGVEIERYGTS